MTFVLGSWGMQGIIGMTWGLRDDKENKKARHGRDLWTCHRLTTTKTIAVLRAVAGTLGQIAGGNQHQPFNA